MKNIALFIAAAALCAAILPSCDNTSGTAQQEQKGYTDKEAIENILERKSVRSFTSQEVEQEKIDLILRAAMAAPSAMDRRPWHIVVMNGREAMDRLSEQLPYASMLTQAPLAIVVCGDMELSSQWYIDCSAVTQNILLAAEALDLGAVWTGVYPSEERMQAVGAAIGLPANVLPLALIPMGYPEGDHSPKDKYDPDRVHYNNW